MENRLTTTRPTNGDLQHPRIGGVASGNDSDNDKIYYGFGVFMGMPLSDLKMLMEDFMEQQARTSRPAPATGISDDHTHRMEHNERSYDHQRNDHMASLHSQQQQQHPSSPKGYECQRGDREYPSATYDQGPQSGEQGGEEDDNSDGSDESGNKSHSLNFILH
ncbi:hypothetical protein PsorP6_000198 [Peronosclerospora sorghi]|uniref:Uncharacterized protein n=1 Tax=Peronosclerospora sorghi TaxID=230839 RepID=A0ACC0WT43_9STRA|nr:hypothetical protein PsorP6_000198 [Peronosclerospora sorghi]